VRELGQAEAAADPAETGEDPGEGDDFR
jgi:hypothetical protein